MVSTCSIDLSGERTEGRQGRNRDFLVVVLLTIMKREESLSHKSKRMLMIPFSRLWSSEYRTYRKPLVKQISALNVARHLAISSGENFLTTAVHSFGLTRWDVG